MNQDNGGIIGKINTPTTTVASGVWGLQDQFEAQSIRGSCQGVLQMHRSSG